MSLIEQYGKITGTTSRKKANLNDALVVKNATIDLTISGKRVTLPKAESVQIVAERLQEAKAQIAAQATKIKTLESQLIKLTADLNKVISIINRSRRNQ